MKCDLLPPYTYPSKLFFSFYFLSSLLGIIDHTLSEMCPGLLLERHAISPAHLGQHLIQPVSHSSHTLMAGLLEHGLTGTVRTGDVEEVLADVVCLGSVDIVGNVWSGSNGPSNPGSGNDGPGTAGSGFISSGSNASGNTGSVPNGNSGSGSNGYGSSTNGSVSGFVGNTGGVVLGPHLHASNLPLPVLQRICSLLDPPESMGRDWCMLAVLFGLTDMLPHLDPGDDPAESPTARIVRQWLKGGPASTVSRLLDILKELGRMDAVEVVMRTAPFIRVFPVGGEISSDDISMLCSMSHTSSSNISR